MDSLATRRSQRVGAARDVGFARPGEAADDRTFRGSHFRRDRVHRVPVTRRRRGKARLDHVDAEPRELSGNFELLWRRHRTSGRLLAVPQRRIEDQNAIAPAHAPPWPGLTSFGWTKGIMRRSDRPTASMGWSISLLRDARKFGWPWLFSSIHALAKLPSRISASSRRIVRLVSSVTICGPA